MLNRHGLVEDSKTVAPDSPFEKCDGSSALSKLNLRVDHGWPGLEGLELPTSLLKADMSADGKQ